MPVRETLVFGRGESLTREQGYLWAPASWSSFSTDEIQVILSHEYVHSDVVVWVDGEVKMLRVRGVWLLLR
jgi:hypothetical protein